MKLSFTKICPYCAQELKLKLGDDWKKSLQCSNCSQELEFYSPNILYFIYTFVGFWIIGSLDYFFSLPIAILIYFAITGWITIPVADLIKRKEPLSFRSYIKKMYPVIYMIILATLANSVIIVGYYLFKKL